MLHITREEYAMYKKVHRLLLISKSSPSPLEQYYTIINGENAQGLFYLTVLNLKKYHSNTIQPGHYKFTTEYFCTLYP